jgi:hypothetical protein
MAMIALAVHPSGEAHLLSDVLGPDLAAGVCPI